MPTVRLTLAYDGAEFSGWAAQPGRRTVEGELSTALERVLGEPVALAVAGRTDAGVHARGQVASVVLDRDPPESLARSLNGLTPGDIAVFAAERERDDFDARRDARSRTYRYRLLASPVRDPFERGRALWWPRRIDRAALDASAAALLGTHDFTAFTPTETDHVRFERDVLRAEWTADPPAFGREAQAPRPATDPPAPGREAEEASGPLVLSFWIEADAFMRHMVRVLVGTMLEVAGGRRTLDDFASLLDGAPRSRAGETAPPHGLYLVSVRY